MKISWNWLEEWIDLDGLDPEEVADRLTMAGLEVDGVERLGEGTDDIIVARIVEIAEHPNADKLVLCKVDDGSGERRQVVCGAKNMGEGDRVPLALPGSQPPNFDFEIGERKVRGQTSRGMLCSAEELGLAERSEGLLILSDDAEVGRPVFEALGLKDTIIEIDLTPNRPDCLSHLGVARELAALYGRDLRTPGGGHAAWDGAEAPTATEAAGLRVDDAQGCPRYLFAVVDGVAVAESPAWLKARLAAVGQRSVNNLVDVTNYVLMDVGQPLHAFDLDALAGPQIVVRRASAGESLEGIDHRDYALTGEDLVIADAQRPVAIAGVMGGADTEVGDQTTRILIECAYFDPMTVRRTAKRHGLHTESSHRFERGVDPAGLERALARAVDLVVRTQQDLDTKPVVRSGIGEASVDGYTEPVHIALDPALCRRVLGADVTGDEVADYLEALGLEVGEGTTKPWQVAAPTWRPDLTRPIDLVEEVARMVGYDKIRSTLPHGPMGYVHRADVDSDEPQTILSRTHRRLLDRMRTQLLAFGIYEAANFGFMSPDDLDLLRVAEGDRRREVAELANPLVRDDAYMQTTLVPSLLDNLQTNLAHRSADVALFEFGRRYFTDGERPTLGLVLHGRRERHFTAERDWDFFDLKGVVEAIASPFDLDRAVWQPPDPVEAHLHPGVQAEWVVGDRRLGWAGRLHPEIARELEIDGPVLVAEVFVDALFDQGVRQPGFEPLSRYPSVRRDFALLYDVDRPYAAIDQGLRQLARENARVGELLESVELFDVYVGEQVPAGKRSLALSVVYRSPERTLTEEDVEKADAVIIDWLESKAGAELRG